MSPGDSAKFTQAGQRLRQEQQLQKKKKNTITHLILKY